MNDKQMVETATEGNLEQNLRAGIEGIQIVTVVDAATFERAGELRKKIVELEKMVADYWRPIREGAHKTWKGIVAKESAMADPLAEKKRQQIASAKSWADAEEAKRVAAERAAQEAARKQAEEDALARAEQQAAAGDQAGAEEILNAPVDVPQVQVQKAVPAKHSGMLTKYYSAALAGATEAERIASLKELVAAIAAGKVPVQAVALNEVFCNTQARQFKSTAALGYPGVVVNVI